MKTAKAIANANYWRTSRLELDNRLAWWESELRAASEVPNADHVQQAWLMSGGLRVALNRMDEDGLELHHPTWALQVVRAAIDETVHLFGVTDLLDDLTRELIDVFGEDVIDPDL